jgi:polysaccharide biosynthesis transport protein
MAVDDNARTTLGDYADLIKRRRQYFLSIIPISILLAVFLAYILPASYRSTATILLEPSSIPLEMVKTTPTNYADQQIELVQRRVLTTARLAELIKKVDPYPDRKDLGPIGKARKIVEDTQVEKVDPITLEPLKESDAFSIHYLNSNPELSAVVARQLADLFVNYNRMTRTERASETYNFLLAQSKDLAVSIQQIEQRMAEFKRTHADMLPEDQNRNQSSLLMTQREVDDVEAQVRLAQQRTSQLELDLSQTPRTMVGAVQDPRTQIATLRAELAGAQQKYTPDHPEIKRLNRAIAELSAQVGASAAVGTGVPDNPEYLRVANDLAASRGNLAALRANAYRSRMAIQNYQQKLARAPTVERDYMQLQRDHEIAQGQYADVQKKLRESEYTKAVETEERGERFTMIRTPQAADTPFSPNRLGIILVGLVLGGGLAFGIAAFVDSSDPTVRSARDLLAFAKIATLGAVPIIHNQYDRSQHTRRWSRVAIAYAVALLIVTATVVRSVQHTGSEAARVHSNIQ